MSGSCSVLELDLDNSWEERVGIIVMVIIRDKRIEMEIVIVILWNSCLVLSFIIRIGMNIMIVVRVDIGMVF